MLARRYAVGVLHLAFSKSSVLCINELLKLVISLGCVAAHPANKGRLSSHLKAVVVQVRLPRVPYGGQALRAQGEGAGVTNRYSSAEFEHGLTLRPQPTDDAVGYTASPARTAVCSGGAA
jgi:hypothetical protein